jgi:hypothetical protein
VCLAACTGGQTGTPASADLDASVVITCTHGPDASTPLGVRTQDLWDQYAGVYTLPSNRIVQQGQRFAVQNATFTVTITPTIELQPGSRDCSVVAASVRVQVQSTDAMVNEDVLGVLRGSPLSADVAFASSEYAQNIEPRVYGSLVFQQGQALQLRLKTDALGSWVAPPVESP